jgi:hypothetical protein
MSIFKKREKKDSVKSKELKRSTENRTEDVGVSAFKLRGRRTGDGGGSGGN